MNISKNCGQDVRLFMNTGANINSSNNYSLRSTVRISCSQPNLCGRVGLGIKTTNYSAINFTGYSFLFYDFINKDELIFLKDYVPASGGGAIPAQVAYQTNRTFSWSFGTVYIMEIAKNATAIKGRINDSLWYSDTSSTIWKEKTGWFTLNMGNNSLESALWDYAAIRKFTEIEPIWAIGAEQQRLPLHMADIREYGTTGLILTLPGKDESRTYVINTSSMPDTVSVAPIVTVMETDKVCSVTSSTAITNC
jgi:hypothetical protein